MNENNIVIKKSVRVIILAKRLNETVLNNNIKAIEHKTNKYQKTNEHVENFIKFNNNNNNDYNTNFNEKIIENINII